MNDDPRSARERILEAAIQLFQERGYHGAGLTDVINEAGAPKSSLYYHFPKGKLQLAAAALEAAATDYEAWLAARRKRNASAANLVRELAASQARWLERTRWRQGTLFAMLGQAVVPELQDALLACSRRRREPFERVLREDGVRDASGLCALALAALDGGVLQAMAARDTRLLLRATERAARAIEAEAGERKLVQRIRRKRAGSGTSPVQPQRRSGRRR